MKKYTLIAVVLVLSLFNLAGAFIQSASADDGNIGCQSLAKCRGVAVCNSDGYASGCFISCDNGASVNCPEDNPE